MSILTAFKNTFLPSAEVSAQRRLNVFGTENKTVVGTVIIGAAAAAIAAPAIIGAAGGTKVVAAKVGSAIAANPVKSLIVTSIAAPVIAGTVANDPTSVPKAAAGYVNLEKNLYSVAKEPSVEGAQKLFSENPILASTLGGAALFVAGKGAVGGASLLSNALTASKISNASDALIEAQQTYTLPNGNQVLLPANSTPSTASPPSEPLTRQTQVIGKEPSSAASRKKRRTVARSAPSNPIRVQILNQNTYIEA